MLLLTLLALQLPCTSAMTYTMAVLVPLTGPRRLGLNEVEAAINVTLSKLDSDPSMDGTKLQLLNYFTPPGGSRGGSKVYGPPPLPPPHLKFEKCPFYLGLLGFFTNLFRFFFIML